MKEILSDPVFEQTMAAQLSRVLASVQELLSTWDALHFQKLTTVSELYELIHSPENLYNSAVKELTALPAGLSEQAASEYQAGLSLPDPRQLYDAAQLCKRSPYTVRELGLFNISKGRAVLTPEAQKIVKQKSVFCDNALQEKAFNELSELVEKFNSVNSYLGGR